MSGFSKAISFVEHWEGGWVNDPDDLGGETIYGISSRSFPKLVFSEFWNDPTPDKAKAIYKKHFWEANNFDALPEYIGVIAFDMAVNHGRKNAIKILQKGARGLLVDGVMGGKTIARLNQGVSVSDIIQARLRFYDEIVERRDSQRKFLNGWQRRSCALIAYSIGVQANINVTPEGELA